MRSFLLASIVALVLPGCVQDIAGGGGDDGSNAAGTCGDGVVGTGETCDDGNTTNGDGCSSVCTTETSATPKIAGSITIPAVLELYNEQTATLNLTGLGGFKGTATLAISLVDASNAPITTATITAATTADLSSGSASVPIKIKLPLAYMTTPAAEIQGMLKVDITSTVDPLTVMAAADIKPIFTIAYAAGTGTGTATHALNGMAFTVLQGTVINIKNDDTGVVHITHGSGAQGGTGPFTHETVNATAGLAGHTYSVPTAAITPSAITTYTLGCHSHPGTNNAEYMQFKVM